MGALCMEQLCGMNLHYQHHSLEYFWTVRWSWA